MDLQDILLTIGDLINIATPIVVALALLYFFWGLATYILNQGNEKKKEGGREIMIWGIVALFIMVSVWGIINVVRDTFSIDTDNIDGPGIDIDNNGGGSTR